MERQKRGLTWSLGSKAQCMTQAKQRRMMKRRTRI
jgi:hypothetical protein